VRQPVVDRLAVLFTEVVMQDVSAPQVMDKKGGRGRGINSLRVAQMVFDEQE